MRKSAMRKILLLLLPVFGLLLSRHSEGAGSFSDRGATILVREQSVARGKPGDELTMDFEIENVGTEDAYRVYVTAFPSDDGEAIPTDGAITLEDLRAGDSERISFRVQVDPSAVAGTKRLPIRIRYSERDPAVPMRELKLEGIIQVEPAPEKFIWVSEMHLIPAKVVPAGSPFSVGLRVENTGSVPVSNVVLELQGLKENGVFLAEGLNLANIPTLEPGGSEYLLFSLRAEEKAGVAA